MEPSCWESAKRWYVQWSPGIAGGLLLFNLAFFAGVLCIDAGRFLTNSAPYGWATALATVSATGAALYIAGKAAEQARKKDAFSGKLLTVRLFTWVQNAYTRIKLAELDLNERNWSPMDLEPHYKTANDILQSVDEQTIYAFDPKLAALLMKFKALLEFAVTFCALPFDRDSDNSHVQKLANDLEATYQAMLPVIQRVYEEVVGPIHPLRPPSQ